jgi:general L-amino acid transport system permease protein
LAVASKRKAAAAWAWQLLILSLVAGLLAWLAHNTLENMRARGIQTGFAFLAQTAGFDISESLIRYESVDPYGRAFLVGLLNTLRVALPGLVLATVLGVLLGAGRFARNLLVRGLCQAYVELLRNVPLLLQLLCWYLLLAEYLPPVFEAWSLGGWALLSKNGLALPWPQWSSGLQWGLPRVDGFAVEGGVNLSPEYVAVLLGLVLYTAAFIAEVVRAGIAAVPVGQAEAALSLGLSRRQTLRRVVLPQALRVIVPPLTGQYLNLIKNSSLAVAVGYPELVSVTNTTLNQTGRAVECVALIMAVYLSLSLLTAGLMGLYNRHVALKGR